MSILAGGGALHKDEDGDQYKYSVIFKIGCGLNWFVLIFLSHKVRNINMKEIVKVCKKHGDLNISQVYEERPKNKPTFRFRCKACRKDYSDANREKLREKSREYEKTKRKRPKYHYENYMKPYQQEWREIHKDEINEKIRKDREQNPEKYREWERNKRATNLQKYRELDVIKGKDITYEKYKWMLDKQDSKCAACGDYETKKSRTQGQICRLAIDHNHETGEVRELLCHNCNIVVGHLKESLTRLENIKQYMIKHNCK